MSPLGKIRGNACAHRRVNGKGSSPVQGEFSQPCSWINVEYAAYQFGIPDDKALRLNTYVNVNGREVKASPAYKNYQIVSSLNYVSE